MPTLADIMTSDVLTADANDPVARVAAAMVQRRVGSALVMEAGWLAGIFTERDVLRAAASGQDLTASTVGDWMTRDPEVAKPDLDTAEAVEIMVARGFRHLPVTDGSALLGIVSLRDLLATRIARSQ